MLDANYGGGFVEVFSLAKDGSLDTADRLRAARRLECASAADEAVRALVPHGSSNKFGLVADLGMDEVVVYRFDEKTGKLTPNDPPFTKVTGGMGPRHLVFHPNGKWVYGIAELANEVMAFSWDGAKGTLTPIRVGKDAGGGFKDPSTAAEIAVHANGKFLYASNRGEDSLVVYAIDATTGELSFKQRVSSRGKVPRYFTFDPSNKWLIVSNQEGANVSVFGVDAKSGELAPAGEPVSLVKPMAVVFL